MEQLPLRDMQPKPEEPASAKCIVCEEEYDYDDTLRLDAHSLEDRRICIWCQDKIKHLK